MYIQPHTLINIVTVDVSALYIFVFTYECIVKVFKVVTGQGLRLDGLHKFKCGVGWLSISCSRHYEDHRSTLPLQTVLSKGCF